MNELSLFMYNQRGIDTMRDSLSNHEIYQGMDKACALVKQKPHLSPVYTALYLELLRIIALLIFLSFLDAVA